MPTAALAQSRLPHRFETPALLGGLPTVQRDAGDAFAWPIITDEDKTAAVEVLERGAMSALDVTYQYEAEFAAWQGTKYALACNNGTAAIHSALFGVGVGVGDEIICPSVTYWASCLQAFSLGATIVFADLDPQTLCIDPDDIERHISEKTKAIVVVHFCAHPCAMDKIMEIARRHDLKVIEDVSHAQGGMYKGKKLGTWGDVAAMSLMSGKSLIAGEGGMLVTDDCEIYERAIALGHYERLTQETIQSQTLRPYLGLPMGGYKYRIHQLSSAVGRVQLKYYDERCREIRAAMNYFWDCLKDVSGVLPHRVDESEGSNMAGWYGARGLYVPKELGNLSVSRFAAAVCAEGSRCTAGVLQPLHLHSLLNECDVYGHGRPTRIANASRDVRQHEGSLPFAETLNCLTFSIPWFKKFDANLIEQHANAFRKVAASYAMLLPGDSDDGALGSLHMTTR